MGTMLSRILGLARDLILMALFTRFMTDAWLVAFRIPNFFRRILGEGSFSLSLIPVFVEVESKHGADAGKRLVSEVFSLLCLILAFLSISGGIFIDEIVQLAVSGKGFTSIPGKVEQTQNFARVMFFFIIFISQFAFFMAVLNAKNKFFAAAAAPALFNLTVITFTLLASFTQNVEFLAWGVLFGGALQAAILVPSLIKIRLLPFVVFGISRSTLRVLSNMLPSALGMGLIQIMGIVNLQFASRLPEGTHTYIYAADRLLELPLSLISVSLGVALLPNLSKLYTEGNIAEMHNMTRSALSLNWFLALPAGMAFYFFAQPLVELIYLRGQFVESDVAITAAVIQFYAVLTLTSSAIRILVPSFYAAQKMWTPALCSMGGLALHLVIAPGMIESMGLMGLLTSTVISSMVTLTLVLAMRHVYFGGFGYADFLRQLGKMLPSLALTGLVLFGLAIYFESEEMPWKKVQVVLSILLVIGFYLSSSYLFGVEQCRVYVGKIKQKMSRS